MKKPHLKFTSFLADEINDFIRHKRSLGKKFDTEEKVLHLLDKHIIKKQLINISKMDLNFLKEFLVSRPRPRPGSYNHLLSVVRRFCDWLVRDEKISTSPISSIRSKRETSQRIPFIFNSDNFKALLALSEQLPDRPRTSHRGEIYSMIFILLYGLGLRVGEISRLCKKDVDAVKNVLIIRQTKFLKDRLVPFGPKIARRLQEYIKLREHYYKSFDLNDPLFSCTNNIPIHPGTISQIFHNLVLKLQLDVPNGVSTPHLHTLRHSFAVGTLLRWYKLGINPMQRLIHLSTFLGHVDPSSTAVYLTITEDLLREANLRFEKFATHSTREEIYND
jgi:site-specific recombinase XerD